MSGRSALELAQAAYPALAAGNRNALEDLLHPDFVATFAAGMPLGLGGVRRGRDAAIGDGWWAIGRAFAVSAEPHEWIEPDAVRVLVLGRYRGRARSSGAPLDAAFAHLWSAHEGRLSVLLHYTDTARWADALDAGPQRS